MIRIVHTKIDREAPGLFPRIVHRTTVYILWVVPVLIIDRDL